MRCVICRQDFDFAAGQTAVVLHHVAYGFDFVHSGLCEAQALSLIFPEPGFDCAAFAHDTKRSKVVAMLGVYAVVEYRDGSRQVERITREDDWTNEPGAAYFDSRHSMADAELAA